MSIIGSASIPLLTLTGEFGLQIDGTASLPVLTLSASDQKWGSGSGSIPSITLSGTMEVGGNTLSEDLPLLTLDATGLTGSVVSLDAILPLITLTATARGSNTSSTSLPLLTLSGSAHTNIAITGAASLPRLTLVGYARTTSAAIIANAVTTLCCNTKTFGISEYTNFNFTGYASFQGHDIAITSAGVFELTGDTDATTDIDCEVVTGQLLLADPRSSDSTQQKQLDSVYINMRTYDDISVIAITGEDTKRYSQIVHREGGLGVRRAKFGKALKARTWQLGVANVNGGDLEVSTLDARPVILKRRIG